MASPPHAVPDEVQAALSGMMDQLAAISAAPTEAERERQYDMLAGMLAAATKQSGPAASDDAGEVLPTRPLRTARSSHLAQQKLDAAARAAELTTRLTETAFATAALSTDGWLDTSLLGSALPGGAVGSAVADGVDADPSAVAGAVAVAADANGLDRSKPFALPVRIEVEGMTADQAAEQGMAIVREVQTSFERGPVVVSKRQGGNAGVSCVMWQNLGAHSIRLDPAKSNRINWLDKSWAARSLALGAASTWSAQRSMLLEELPHAEAWVRVMDRAYEDGGVDIKDDCRLDSSSARCHQDGGNCMLPGKPPPLVRLAINVSTAGSGRSLDYLRMASDGRLVDGDERAALLLHSVPQDSVWHGCAQSIAGYVQGVSPVCHSSSAGNGPCLKRIITVFGLPSDHPLAGLTAIQRLVRIGITVLAL